MCVEVLLLNQCEGQIIWKFALRSCKEEKMVPYRKWMFISQQSEICWQSIFSLHTKQNSYIL